MDDEPARGVPEWVVTYGDMMSLLLTFFIMLVSLSEVVADKRYRAVLESLHRYIGYRSAPAAPPGRSFPLNSLISRMETLGAQVSDPAVKGYGGIKRRAVEGDDLRVFTTREGAEVRVGEPVFFAPGQAALSDEAKSQLEMMAATRTGALAGYPNKIEIRAYVSHAPLPADAPYADKTLLTYARARAVFDFLKRNGVAAERMRIGTADGRTPTPLPGDRHTDRLDRVEILMLDAFTSDYVGPKDVPR